MVESEPRPADRPYRHNPAQFLDIEAEVDRGEVWEDPEPDDDEDFIEDHPESDEEDSFGQLRYRELDQQLSQARHRDAEELVRFAKPFTVPRHLDILSDHSTRRSSHDVFETINESLSSRLWRVPVKRGSEAASLDFLRLKAKRADRQGDAWPIRNALSYPTIPGAIYVECEDAGDIRRICKSFNAFYSKCPITLVPPHERTQLVNMPNVVNPISVGDWARIKEGLYEGDICYVTSVGNEVTTLVVPRVHYQTGAVWTRPPQGLFDPDLIRAVFGQQAVTHLDNGTLLFQQQNYYGGLLECSYSRGALEVNGACPTLQEIELFAQSPQWDARATAKWEADMLAATLRVDDRVEIYEGEWSGMLGKVTNVDSSKVEVEPFADDLRLSGDFRIELRSTQVRRIFSIGDYIQVQHGEHTGKQGYVVNVTGRTLEFVEWDKSIPYAPEYEPDPRQHHSVFTHTVEFAQEQIHHFHDPNELPNQHRQLSSRRRQDPMAGTRVLIVKPSRLRGYRGIIQYTHKALKFFGVRLDATGKIVHLSQNILVDASSGLSINFFRQRDESILPLRITFAEVPLAESTPYQAQTPMWESPLCSTTPAWDPFSGGGEDRGERDSENRPPASNTVQGGPNLPLGVKDDWLSSDKLHGKSVQVRFIGLDPGVVTSQCDSITARKLERIPKRSLGFTTGQPVSSLGDMRMMEVKMMAPGCHAISIPLQTLEAVKPPRAEGPAIVISGEHFGKEGLVLGEKGRSDLWELILDDQELTVRRVTASPDHLVVCRPALASGSVP